MTRAVRHFLDLSEIAPETLKGIVKDAHAMKALKYAPPQILQGLSLAMVFEKRSTRTRVSFEVAMKQLGGHTVVMNTGDMQLTGAESLADTAKVLSRFVDGVMVRTGDHAIVEELARHATIPVINGLTDYSHPCQIMADMMTIEEKLGRISGRKIAWFGDFNNVARSFVHAASIWDFDLFLAIPEGLAPRETFPPMIHLTSDPHVAADQADVLVTDTWVSMGQEGKAIERFAPYQINGTLMARAKETALFMHCMPIHRGEEVTDAIADSPRSVIYDEAENRLHAQKAILAWCLQNTGVRITLPLGE